MRRPLALAALTLLANAGLPAQNLYSIRAGSATSTVQSMGPTRRNIALAPDDRLFALVRETDPSDAHLYVTFSADGGRTWIGQFDTPTTGDGVGAIVFGPDCHLLHAVWHALDGGTFSSVYYQAFDVANLAWVGTPVQLAAGAGAEDQYYASDIEVTARGTVVCAFSTHRRPPAPWRLGWATAIAVLRRGATQFDPWLQVNTDYTGVNLNMQAIGETVHMTYRTATGGYGIMYRAYDTLAAAFTTAADVPLAGAGQSTMNASNTAVIAAADDGWLYVLYATGAGSAGSGAIHVASAAPGAYGTWTSQLVANDPDLLWGNNTYNHYSLGRSGRGLVFAIYAKRTLDQHGTLYVRPIAQGQLVAPEVAIRSTSDADRFAQVCGLRNTQSTTTLQAVVESRAAVHPGNLVELFQFAATGRMTEFGLSCQGSLPAYPRMSSRTAPVGGSTFVLDLTGLPGGQNGVLFAGTACLRPPLRLDFVGMHGCALFQDTPGYMGFLTAASGATALPIVVPVNPSWAGLPILLQSVVIAPGANQFGAVVTNGLMAYFR